MEYPFDLNLLSEADYPRYLCSKSIIGIGIDIVSCERIRRMLRRHKERFLDRCFTADEVKYALSKYEPVPHLAARIAAKEAFFKALRITKKSGIKWKDIEIRHNDSSLPELVLTRAALKYAEEKGLIKSFVSISHEREWAIAMVVLVGSH